MGKQLRKLNRTAQREKYRNPELKVTHTTAEILSQLAKDAAAGVIEAQMEFVAVNSFFNRGGDTCPLCKKYYTELGLSAIGVWETHEERRTFSFLLCHSCAEHWEGLTKEQMKGELPVIAKYYEEKGLFDPSRYDFKGILAGIDWKSAEAQIAQRHVRSGASKQN